MIKKSIITFSVLFCIHLLFVYFNLGVGKATHQWQDNVIKAQKFFYDDYTDTVIIGTSLSARIDGDSIPTIKSLAFSGCSVEDGLIIILAKERKPHYVLVETNLFFKKGNPQLFSNQTDYLLYKIKEFIPSLREQYQPVCLLSYALNKIRENDLKGKGEIKNVDIPLLNKYLERRQREECDTLNNEIISDRLCILKSYINILERQGVKFIFYEIPINKKLYDANSFSQTRVIVKEEFPDGKYKYLPSDTTSYLTTDGIHLDDRGARVYSHFFKGLLSQTDLK